MVKQLNGLVHWNRYFPEAVCAIALLLVSFQPAFSATKPDGTLEITAGKEQFMSTLASMPYTSSGTGPALYALECSTCPFSQAFERDWKGQLDGVEMRRILIALDAKTANETAYLVRTRDITDFYAFMNHTKVAPPIKACNCPEDNKAIQAVSSVVGPFGKVLKPIMIKNGWPKAPAPPQFMWETNGRVYAGRYSKNSFPEILSMLRSGTQTAQASAPPSRTPAHESVSTNKESTATETTGQLMAAEKNSPNPAGDASARNSGSQAVGSGGLGPDVLGLRIGMSPAEVRAIFKSRILVSEELRKQFAEIFNPLTFNAEAQGLRSEPVPNGKYLSMLGTSGRHEHSAQEFRATFGPVPEQERLIYFYRSVILGNDNAPTFNIMEKTLVEKYGTPTNSERRYKHYFSWVYDNNGTLYKAGDIKDSTTLKMCRDIATKFGSSLPDFTDYGVVLKFEDFPARCGATLLDVQLDLNGDSADSLVKSHSTTMTGFNMAVHESKISKAISDKAASAASAAAIKNGQQQKPEF
jgi:hypothetical protein